MAISKDEVRKVALLARLGLTEKELESMAGHMESILEFVARLSEVDTKDVQPTAHVLDLTAELRPDEPHLDGTAADILGSAPDAGFGFFKVPRVIGGEEV